MDIVESLIKFLHVAVSVILILAVLLQPGKGGDLGSMFGGGSAESVFGSSGAVPFLAKLTRVLGIVFFATSLCLGYFATQGSSSSVLKGVNAPAVVFDATQDVDGGTIGTLDNMANTTILDETTKSDGGSGKQPSENLN